MAASAWTSAPARSLDFLSDERLARLAARGDQRAFGALFERHQPGLTRYCRTILRHSADAEDAAQNAMVSALRALESGTVPMRVKPWLYKIAHNEALALVRSRRPAEELDESTLPAVADAEEAGEVRRRLGQLMADLQALTERQREALVLRELCGMGYEEIATTLGSSRSAAQQTVFEARSALMQFGEGRALDCEGVQRALSDCDGMRLRTRTVRAHLRGCDCCRSFESSLVARRRDLGLLFPPAGTAGGVFALIGRLLGSGGGEPLLAGAGLKGAAIGLAILAGGGAVVATSLGGSEAAAPPAVTAAPAAAHAAAPASAQPAASGAVVKAGGSKAHVGARPGRAGRHPAAGGPGAPGATAAPGTAASAAEAGEAAASSGAADGGHGPTKVASAGSGGAGGGSSSPASTSGGSAHAVLPSRSGTAPAAAQVVAGAGDAVAQVTETATEVVQGAADQAGAVVQDTTSAVTGAVGDVTSAVGQVPTTAQGAVGAGTGQVTGSLPHLP